MTNPALTVPGAMDALQALGKSTQGAGLSESLVAMVLLRASQINGCAVCVDMHAREMQQAGDKDARIFAVSAWRESPHFNDGERAALALTEAGTRIADRPDPVPDEIWNEAARHFDQKQLASLVLTIASINVWNRLNVMVRQVPGAWTPAPASH